MGRYIPLSLLYLRFISLYQWWYRNDFLYRLKKGIWEGAPFSPREEKSRLFCSCIMQTVALLPRFSYQHGIRLHKSAAEIAYKPPRLDGRKLSSFNSCPGLLISLTTSNLQFHFIQFMSRTADLSYPSNLQFQPADTQLSWDQNLSLSSPTQ